MDLPKRLGRLRSGAGVGAGAGAGAEVAFESVVEAEDDWVWPRR